MRMRNAHMFDEATNWSKSGDGSLTFSSPGLDGQKETTLLKRPREIYLQLERISYHRETRRNFDSSYRPEAGFSQNGFISGSALLPYDRIHGVEIETGEGPVFESVAFMRLDVVIKPIDLDNLNEIAEGDSFRDDLGKLVFSRDERPELYVLLHLDQETFDCAARNIREGGIQSAQILMIADLYGLEWGGIPGCKSDYVILMEEGDFGLRGEAKAQLNEITFKWSSLLDTKMDEAGDRPSKVEAATKNEKLEFADEPEHDSAVASTEKAEGSGWSSFLKRST